MTISTGDMRRVAPPMLDDAIAVEAATAPMPLTRMGFPEGVRPLRESALVVAIVAPLLTVIYRLWDVRWHVPFVYEGDGLTTAAYTKALMERTWYFTSPRLAAPFGSDWRDFPLGGENLHWLALKTLGLVSGDYAFAENAYFFLSFFAIALTTYFVARYLSLSKPVALVVGVLYAFLPYHAYRNVGHLARGVYYILPLAVLVLLWACDHREELLVTDGKRTRWRRGRVAFALGVGLVLGASDTQNAVFMVSILAVVTVLATISARDWRPLLIFVMFSAVTMGSLSLNNLPYFLSRIERGPNDKVAHRSIKDQDGFALRPVNLVLPAPAHRIGALADLASESAGAQATNSESGGTSLGIVGSVGLVASLGTLLAMALGSRRRTRLRAQLACLGMLNAIAILLGAIGGFAFLLALAGFLQYRSWNRISLFIGLFSLLATAILLERVFERMRRRARNRVLVTVIIGVTTAVLIVGGAFDQITPTRVPDYAATARIFHEDATFYHRLEQRLPRGDMVFDLPVSTFPEPGRIANMTDYAQLAGYLHTDHLRFSYGGMTGRPDGDWTRNLATCDPRTQIAQIAAAGFDSAVVDTRGYDDGGVAFLRGVRPLVGRPTQVSADGHLVALDLGPLRSRMRARAGASSVHLWQAALLGLSPTWQGFSYAEQSCDGSRRWAIQPDAKLTFTNPGGHTQPVVVASDLEANPLASAITVRGPGFTRDVALTAGEGRIEQTVDLPPGTSTLHFRVTGPRVQSTDDSRTLWFALLNPTLAPVGSPTLATWAHSTAAEAGQSSPRAAR